MTKQKNGALEFVTTSEVARQLGLAVRSVQLMVDRGELDAWRTHGGHRRITRTSLERWRARGTSPAGRADQGSLEPPISSAKPDSAGGSVLLIEDSIHFQNLVKLLFLQYFPQVALHVAADGFSGLAMAGQLQPDVLLIDILLPGMDGATLMTAVRSHPQFDRSHLIVLTALDAVQLEPYAFALGGAPVVHKSRLVLDLPALLHSLLLTKQTVKP